MTQQFDDMAARIGQAIVDAMRELAGSESEPGWLSLPDADYHQKETHGQQKANTQMLRDQVDFGSDMQKEQDALWRESMERITERLARDNNNDYMRIYWLERQLEAGRTTLTDTNV